MPKLKDIHDRMPAKPHYFSSDDFVAVSEHFEPCAEDDRYQYHVWTSAEGYKRVKLERTRIYSMTVDD